MLNLKRNWICGKMTRQIKWAFAWCGIYNKEEILFYVKFFGRQTVYESREIELSFLELQTLLPFFRKKPWFSGIAERV